MTDYAAYCFYVNRPDLLRRAVNAFPGLWKDLTIVDNSKEQNVTTEFKNARVFTPPVPLTYSQAANWMLKDAVSRGKEFIVHFHSDATTSNPLATKQLLDFARKAKADGKRHACWWTFYDILWCINPDALMDVGGWDTTFLSYFVDNDLRRRFELAGWECVNTNIQGLSHEGSATINSDEKLGFVNGMNFGHQSALYHHKWGNEPGKELYTAPWNRPDIFKDMKP